MGARHAKRNAGSWIPTPQKERENRVLKRWLTTDIDVVVLKLG